MENASKALIIAGAILLAILIISLGLIVYNQAKETVGSVNLSQQEIEAFNSKFTSFEGTQVSGAQVNSLIQTVIASDQQAINDNTGRHVTISFPSVTSGSGKKDADTDVKVSGESVVTTDKSTGNNSTNSAKVIAGRTYTVEFSYDKALISTITCTAN